MTDELIVDGYGLDLSEQIPVPITFAIADVRDPSKRKQSFSKEVELPDTAINRAFFIGSFGLTTTDNGVSFDATAKASVILKKRGIQVLEGVLKLNKATIINRVLSFNCTVLSDSVDLFQLLSTININELDWSAYDHALNRTNIKASWVATAGTGYYYPLIERGNARLGDIIWRTTDVMPYVYHREVLFKCLDWAGIEWDSAFLDTDMYKNVLFGYGGGEIRTISASDQNIRKVEIDNGDFNSVTSALALNPFLGGGSVATVRTYAYGNLVGNNINPFADAFFTGTETQDLLSQFSDGEIEIQQTGYYSVSTSFVIDYSINVGTMTFVKFTNPKIFVYKNGAILTNISTSIFNYTSTTGTIDFNVNNSFNISAQSGDTYTFKLSLGGATINAGVGIGPQAVTTTLTTTSSITLDVNSLNTTITDGGIVKLGNYLPVMPASTFLLGTIRQFNLYTSDPDIDGIVKSEPLTDYYSSTAVFRDITQEIDHTKPIVMQPSANEYAKDIQFIFKATSDFDAIRYADKWKENYGDLSYSQSSYYAKGENKTELPWATIIPFEVSPGILVPRFIKIDNNVKKQNAGPPRIMFRNGQKTGTFILRDTDTTGSETLTTYPCVHHFDDWQDPTIDLNFKLVNEVYYTATVVTTVNSFSEYYSTFINEMTSPAGQIVSCWVVWNEQDIKNRNFGKLLMINGGLFRLNAIKDFSANVQASTEIELVKVLKAKKKRRAAFTRPPLLANLGGGKITSPPSVGIGGQVITGAPTGGLEIKKLRG